MLAEAEQAASSYSSCVRCDNPAHPQPTGPAQDCWFCVFEALARDVREWRLAR